MPLALDKKLDKAFGRRGLALTLKRLSKLALNRFSETNVVEISSSMTLATVLSIVPLLAVARRDVFRDSGLCGVPQGARADPRERHSRSVQHSDLSLSERLLRTCAGSLCLWFRGCRAFGLVPDR